MERHDLLALMAKLNLAGMRTAYDDVMRDGLKRQRSIQQILGDLLTAEVAEKTARSISYQIGAAKLPLAKELTEFDFAKSPVNEALVRDLHSGSFLETQRKAVFIGGTGAGKSHLSIAITANCIRNRGARARFFNVVDRIAMDDPSLSVDGERTPLEPGMAVTAEIKTGKRRVIDYILSPIAQHTHDALRER